MGRVPERNAAPRSNADPSRGPRFLPRLCRGGTRARKRRRILVTSVTDIMGFFFYLGIAALLVERIA
jgi:hypothetical protein